MFTVGRTIGVNPDDPQWPRSATVTWRPSFDGGPKFERRSTSRSRAEHRGHGHARRRAVQRHVPSPTTE